MGDLPYTTVVMIAKTGLGLVIASAVLFLGVFAAAKYAPRFLWYLLVPAWATGGLGFLIICVVDPSALNIALAVLFIIASVGQGYRIARRTREMSASDDREISSGERRG